MTPTFATYNELFLIAQSLIDTYDYLPDADANYPFCFIERPSNEQSENSDLYGATRLNLHFFGKRSDRALIDDTIAKFHDYTDSIPSTFGYILKRTLWQETPLPEPDDAPGVIHYYITLEILYTRKED